jgi:hypothetical protein
MAEPDQQQPPPLEYPPGPWVLVAALCERQLIDSDNLLSMIRMLDHLTVTTNNPEMMQNPPSVTASATVVIVLAGTAEHDGGLFTLQFNNPNGSVERGEAIPLRFSDSGRPTRVTVNLTMVFREAGTYWIDVLFGGRALTRIPIRIQYRLEEEADHEEPAS